MLQPINVSIAGRMMFKRVMGKASFCNIQDLKGQHSGVCCKRSVSVRSHTLTSRSQISVIYMELRDIAFRTKTGEISQYMQRR